MKPQTFAKFCAGYGFVLTPAQTALSAVSFDGVEPGKLRGDGRNLALELFGDVDRVPPVARAVIVWAKGARIGGTRMAATRLYQLGLTIALDLAPGEKAYGLIVGPDMRIGRQALNYARGMAKHDAANGKIVIVGESRDHFEIERHDGASIVFEALPATVGGSAVRSRTLVGAVMTEAAFFRDEDFAVNDVEVYGALSARIVFGGQLILESTVWARLGLLHQFYRDDFGDPKTALVARCPTALMRPDPHTQAMVNRERQRNPENCAREFDAVFPDGGASEFFDGIAITNAIDEDRPLVSYVSSGGVSGWGADLALIRNSSVLAGVERVGDVYALLELVERKPEPGVPLKLSDVIGDFGAVLERHGVSRFVTDGHVREPAREFAETTKIKIVGREVSISIDEAPDGATGKLETYTLLQTLLREGRFKMPAHRRLEAQLRAVMSRPLAGGGHRIASPIRPDGSHGDLVSAVVLATWSASQASPPGSGPSHFTVSDGRWSDRWGGGGDRGFG